MTPPDLIRLARKMYGTHRWGSRLALNLGVACSTVYRWSHKPKDFEIPHIAEVAIKGLYAKYKVLERKEFERTERLRKAGLLRPRLKRKKVRNS